jgi:hypothetical protein
MIPLINVSDLTRSITANEVTEVWAKPTTGIAGFCLYMKINNKEMMLSTYLSNKPRHFKRADALLKEAGKIGLDEVKFIGLSHKK